MSELDDGRPDGDSCEPFDIDEFLGDLREAGLSPPPTHFGSPLPAADQRFWLRQYQPGWRWVRLGPLRGERAGQLDSLANRIRGLMLYWRADLDERSHPDFVQAAEFIGHQLERLDCRKVDADADPSLHAADVVMNEVRRIKELMRIRMHQAGADTEAVDAAKWLFFDAARNVVWGSYAEHSTLVRSVILGNID